MPDLDQAICISISIIGFMIMVSMIVSVKYKLVKCLGKKNYKSKREADEKTSQKSI